MRFTQRIKASMFVIFAFTIFSSSTIIATPFSVPKHRYGGLDYSNRPPGNPFINLVDFRNIADHVVDQSATEFDPAHVKQGDIVYVGIWMLDWFTEEIHDQIQHPYVLISCDIGDFVPLPWQCHKLIYDPKCAAWFGRNMAFSYHPKMHQTPWGQDYSQWGRDVDAYQCLQEAVSRKPYEKTHLLYMNHTPREWGDRDKIIKMFYNAPFCFCRNKPEDKYYRIPKKQYFEELASSEFTISPFGLESDCVRTWEAFVLGSIPVVEHSFFDAIYEGLPVVIVHDWSEINEAFLHKKKAEIKNRNTEKAYFQYWHDKIKSYQQRIRDGDISHARLENNLLQEDELNTVLEIVKKYGRGNLIYRGLAAGLRPLQVARSMNGRLKIHFCDPWMNREIWNNLGKYLIDKTFLKYKRLVAFVDSEHEFTKIVGCMPRCPVFLDLSHYRSHLAIDMTDKRHALKRDLLQLYQALPKGVVLCGNMAKDTYVHKVLKLMQAQDNISFEQRGTIWLIKKG